MASVLVALISLLPVRSGVVPVPTSALYQKNIDFINAVQKTMNADALPTIAFEQMFDASMATEAMGRV